MLEGKTVVVTGGGTGIGLGIARCLSGAGCRVAIAGRREDKLRAAVEACGKSPEMHWHPVDVTCRDSVQQLFDWVLQEFGQIDVLVNSAGMNIKNRSMAEMHPDQWDQIMAINVTGAYNCMLAALPSMREQRDGLIININSISGLRAWAVGGVAYDASKFALRGLSVAAGNEDNEYGIRVTTIFPGEVDTPLLDQRPVAVSEAHKATILQPDDVGQLVVALVSLPPRAHVPEVTIKPTQAVFV